MKKNEIKKRICENLEFEKSIKQDSFGGILLVALVILLLSLIAAAGCFAFALKIPIFTYREAFGCLVLFLVLDIVLLIININRKISVSQREIKKHAKHLLERLLFFKNQGKLETCYVILTHEAYVRTPEKLDQVISELDAIVEEKSFLDSNPAESQRKLYMEIYMIVVREKVKWKHLARKIFFCILSVWIVANCINAYLLIHNHIPWNYWHLIIEVILLVILALYTFTLGFDVSEEEVLERAKKIYKKYDEIGGNENGEAYGYKTYNPDHLEQVMKGLRELINYRSKDLADGGLHIG